VQLRGRLVLAVLSRMRATLVVESSLVLAAQAFLALFPVVIVFAALAPTGVSSELLDALRDRFGLGGTSATAVRQLIVDRDDVRGSLSFVGVLLVLGSATSFTRALQKVYERAWDLPKLGLRGAWRGAAWVAGLIVYLGLLTLAVRISHSLHIGGSLGAVAAVFLWWWTPYLLLGGRVRGRALVPGAILTAIAQLALSLVGATVLPRTVRSSESQFGPIGVVFAVESWLIVVCGAVVVSTAVTAALVRVDGPVGRAFRGTPDPDGWRRTRPPPPAPAPPVAANPPGRG
jgi:membrane protein